MELACTDGKFLIRCKTADELILVLNRTEWWSRPVDQSRYRNEQGLSEFAEDFNNLRGRIRRPLLRALKWLETAPLLRRERRDPSDRQRVLGHVRDALATLDRAQRTPILLDRYNMMARIRESAQRALEPPVRGVA